MPVDLNEILLGNQAHSLQRLSGNLDDLNGLQSRAFLTNLVGVDLIEAAAAKELSKAGTTSDIAGLNLAAQTPKS